MGLVDFSSLFLVFFSHYSFPYIDARRENHKGYYRVICFIETYINFVLTAAGVSLADATVYGSNKPRLTPSANVVGVSGRGGEIFQKY